MERKQAAQLIQEQMKILFAFAFSKVRNKEEAEAFYGYMWAVARNVKDLIRN